MSEARPQDLTTEQQAMVSRAGVTDTTPSQTPPAAVTATDGGVTAWQGDKRATALWSINQNRNSWVALTDLGWRRLANNSDSAVVALTILASHAKLTQTRIDVREEADGMIHEIYVW